MQYLTSEEKKYWTAYSFNDRINWNLIKAFLRKTGSLAKSWRNFSMLKELNLEENKKKAVKKTWKRVEVEKEYEKIIKEKVKITTIIEPDFPKRLTQIADPPFILFYRGKLLDKDRKVLASVGTRKASSYGKSAVEKLIKPVAEKGVVIVSGLAYGIDSFSHSACLDVGGLTVAVLGGGILKKTIYPASNRKLAEKIISNGGALISEYPPRKRPKKRFFVARNRIIAGLAQACLIVEAPKKSGALITADFAVEEGRDVMAVPGNINQKNSWGANKIIKEGALPVTGPEDLLSVLNRWV